MLHSVIPRSLPAVRRRGIVAWTFWPCWFKRVAAIPGFARDDSMGGGAVALRPRRRRCRPKGRRYMNLPFWLDLEDLLVRQRKQIVRRAPPVCARRVCRHLRIHFMPAKRKSPDFSGAASCSSAKAGLLRGKKDKSRKNPPSPQILQGLNLGCGSPLKCPLAAADKSG